MSQQTTGINAFEAEYMEVDVDLFLTDFRRDQESISGSGQSFDSIDSWAWTGPEIPMPGAEHRQKFQACPTDDDLNLLELLNEFEDESDGALKLVAHPNSTLSTSISHEPGSSSVKTSSDKVVQELLEVLMADDDRVESLPRQPWNATNLPCVPMIEPQQQEQQVLQKKIPQIQQPLEHPQSPTAVSSCCDGCSESLQAMSLNREAEIDDMVAYIKEVIERSSNCKPDEMSSKLKVHEVILTILLNSTYGDKTKDLRRILTFCDENGRETSGECRHFKTLDTETMGLLWQKIKGNKKATYDTFARAMRVRREKSKGYFDYLDSGKRSKKRIYRFGEKTMADMDRMKRTLKQVSEPQGCYY